jgi:uncharacterized damage-inducible protein DinB
LKQKVKCILAAIAPLVLTVSLVVPVRASAAETPGQAYAKLLQGQEKEFVSVAEAMPADKYDFAPTSGEFKGVRTFAQQVTHVASAQYFFFKGFGVASSVDPKALSKLTSKDEIVKAIKDAFAYAEKSAETITTQNAFDPLAEVDGATTRATIAAVALAHTNDHYGQMVVYLRMNGVIPPASRK